MRTIYRFMRWLLVLSAFMTLSTRLSPVTAQSTPEVPNPDRGDYQSLLTTAQTEGHVNVIVGLKVAFQPEGHLNTGQALSQQSGIGSAQAQLVSRIATYNTQVNAHYRTIPFIAMSVDEAGLRALFTDPQVASIEEDTILKIDVLPNLDLIDADNAWVTGSGYDGTGETVAIIDTGVQENHQEFGARLIPAAEACFSSEDTTNHTYHSTCPGGVTSKIGAGAGANCTISGCFHGTHVAGTAAGATAGVAPGANIIAINAATAHTSSSVCGFGTSSPCAILFSHDVISALEYVYSLRNTYSIASVNMSIGGVADFRKYCDTPAGTVNNGTTSYKAAIDNLFSVNIATVVASGNSSYTDAIELPSCISSAVSVGASGIYGGDPNANAVAEFSNSSYMIDLLAPGVHIYSALPGSTYGYSDGTSMAAPHVAGTWALLKQREPNASVTRILTALQMTGVSITDSRNGVTRPRIDVDNALNSLINNTVPARPLVVVNEVDTGSNSIIELYNKESFSVDLTGWKLETYSAANILEVNYTFPAFTLPSHGYVQIREGSGANTSTILFLNAAVGTWNSGAVILKNSGLSIDFVRWGSSTVVPPLGSAWLGNNPANPSAGNTLGRTNTSWDRDEGADWFSEALTLGTQNTVPTLPNDAPTSPAVISALPFSYTENTTFATNTNDPPLNLVPPECASNSNSVWFRYIPPADQVVQFNTSGSDYDTLITVWTGLGTGSQNVVACDDDNGQSAHTSLLSIPLVGGTVYDIQVTGGFISESGFLNFQAQILNVPSNDDVAGAIDLAPIPSTHIQSTLLATDDGPLDFFSCASNTKSVWYRYTATDNTPIRLDTSGSDYDTLIIVWVKQDADYQQIACDDDFYSADNTSRVDWVPTPDTTYYIMISGGTLGDSGNLILNATFAPPPPANDAFDHAVSVGTLPWMNSEDTTLASLDGDDPNPSCDFNLGLGLDVNGTVWYQYIAASDSLIRLSTAGSDFSTLISVWTKQPGWSEKACSDGFGGSTQVDVETVTGNTYYIMIGGTLSTHGGNLVLNISNVTQSPPAPTLLSPPNNTHSANTTPTFTWQSVADAVSYDIQIGTGNPPVYMVTGLTQTSYTPTAFLPGATYHWRVRAVNSSGVHSDWSPTWTYTVDSSSNAIPMQNLFSTNKPTLTWAPVTWAVSYELQVGSDVAFNNSIYNKTDIPASQLSLQLDQDLGQGIYYWRIRAIRANGSPGSWSSTQSFMVVLP